MIIFSDLDGTFLTSKKEVSEKNMEALDALVAAGVGFVPCTGRSLGGIAPTILGHPAVRYAITSNGATVIDLHAGQALHRADLGFERTAKYFELARDRDVTFDIFADGKVFLNRARYDRLGDFITDPFALASVRASRTPYDGDTIDFLASLEHIERIAMYWRDPADRDELTRAISQDDDVSCVRSVPTDIEVSDARATKGAALAWLCDHLGIPVHDAIAFGDNVNDISMLMTAGTGVAMANAEPEARAAADAITASNDEGGVGTYILGLLAH